jgi:hypothetical protein
VLQGGSEQTEAVWGQPWRQRTVDLLCQAFVGAVNLQREDLQRNGRCKTAVAKAPAAPTSRGVAQPPASCP